MKIRFVGEVIPAIYSNSEWYVEGVGDKIKLISDIDVEVSFPVGIDLNVPFDTEDGFDRLPFSSAIGFPRDKDYIVINRASSDGNFWSRYNRWFHKDVIELVASINNQPANLDQAARANRPIIEFEANLKLFNFGTTTKPVIDLIDDFSVDAFSSIEGTLGYSVDGVQLRNGMRILFLADTDPLVRGRIFKVEFIKFTGSGVAGQIALRETEDSLPQINENVLVTKGNTYTGSMWFFNGTEWKRAQEKTQVNQPPLFDAYDAAGVSFADTSKYEASNFKGTEIFSYKTGVGTADSVLGFPLVYRSIDNVGDILFDFDYNSDIVEYQIDTVPQTVPIASGYLKKYTDKNNFINLGAWTKADKLFVVCVKLAHTLGSNSLKGDTIATIWAIRFSNLIAHPLFKIIHHNIVLKNNLGEIGFRQLNHVYLTRLIDQFLLALTEIAISDRLRLIIRFFS